MIRVTIPRISLEASRKMSLHMAVILCSGWMWLVFCLGDAPVWGQNTAADRALSQYPGLSSSLVRTPLIPGLKEGYVPQGIAFIPVRDWIVISAYHDDHRTSSAMHVVDVASGMHLGSLPLIHDGKNMTGHVGGLAWCQNKLWLASEGRLWRIPVPNPEQVKAGTPLAIEKSFAVDSAATSLAATGDQLWVGEFALGTDYPTSKHHHLRGCHAWAALYTVAGTGELKSQAKMEVDRRQVLVPEAVVLIPDKIQGMAQRGNCLVLSSSYRAADSTLEFYRSPLQEPGFEIPLPGGGKTMGYELPPTPLRRLYLPAGAEDLEWVGNDLLVPFEGAANKFRLSWRVSGATIENRLYRLRVPLEFIGDHP